MWKLLKKKYTKYENVSGLPVNFICYHQIELSTRYWSFGKTAKSIKGCCLMGVVRTARGWMLRLICYPHQTVTELKQIPQTVYTSKQLHDLWRSDDPSTMRFFVNIRTLYIHQRLRYTTTLTQVNRVVNSMAMVFGLNVIGSSCGGMFELRFIAIARQFLLSNITAISQLVYVFSKSFTLWAFNSRVVNLWCKHSPHSGYKGCLLSNK